MAPIKIFFGTMQHSVISERLKDDSWTYKTNVNEERKLQKQKLFITC